MTMSKNLHILPQDFDEDDVRDDDFDDWSMLEDITQVKLSKNMLFYMHFALAVWIQNNSIIII
jgi:hypothetical protein